MGTILIIKNADFSENGMPIARILDVVSGSMQATYYDLISTSSIKVRCSPLLKVPVGKQITYSLNGAKSYQGYKPGYMIGVYDKDITNLSTQEQRNAAILADCTSVIPRNSGELESIVYTNNNEQDVWVTIAIGFTSTIKPSDFNISDYKDFVTDKISCIIE